MRHLKVFRCERKELEGSWKKENVLEQIYRGRGVAICIITEENQGKLSKN